MNLSYKYRIYPNKTQQQELTQIFSFCCFLYNSALEERIAHYKQFGKTQKSINYVSQANQLPAIRAYFTSEVKHVYAQSLQQVLKVLHKAFDNFFRRVKNGETPGFPRFKSFSRMRSICFPQVGTDLQSGGGVKLISNKKVQISGLTRLVRIKYHRPFQGIAKTVQIKKEADKYYLIVCCNDIQVKSLPETGQTVAIDLGINNFLTTDQGETLQHPRAFKTSKDKLAERNRKLAAKQKGSNNRKKALTSLQRSHAKMANVRKDWQHKTANKILKDNSIVILEDLDIKSMLKSNNNLQVKNSNITDAAWGNFAQLLDYKAVRAGNRQIVKVEPKNTSKTCSCCGTLNQTLTLDNRIFNCFNCSLSIDRDVNAALNIKRLGMSLVWKSKTSAEISQGWSEMVSGDF